MLPPKLYGNSYNSIFLLRSLGKYDRFGSSDERSCLLSGSNI